MLLSFIQLPRLLITGSSRPPLGASLCSHFESAYIITTAYHLLHICLAHRRLSICQWSEWLSSCRNSHGTERNFLPLGPACIRPPADPTLQNWSLISWSWDESTGPRSGYAGPSSCSLASLQGEKLYDFSRRS